MTDEQIRRRIAAERRRKRRQRRTIIMCIAIVLALVDGYLAGRIIGSRSAGSSVSSEQAASEAEAPAEFISTAEDLPLINTAMAEIGNKGGEKFWSWYGYNSRVSWCACYVSWCEDQVGLISSNAAPRFDYVPEGCDWFVSRSQWLDADETPEAGDLIFFDWEQDGGRDHVGVVTAVVGDKIFTVEGNSSDRCRQKRYTIGDPVIYGYGHIADQS